MSLQRALGHSAWIGTNLDPAFRHMKLASKTAHYALDRKIPGPSTPGFACMAYLGRAVQVICAGCQTNEGPAHEEFDAQTRCSRRMALFACGADASLVHNERQPGRQRALDRRLDGIAGFRGAPTG